jgi:hypothetical protein
MPSFSFSFSFATKGPMLLVYAMAAAFLPYWHWRHVLDALPFLVVLACRSCICSCIMSMAGRHNGSAGKRKRNDEGVGMPG